LTSWKNQVVNATKNAFLNQENSEKAEGAFAYMKGIAPFIGISAPDRRLLTKSAWRDLRLPSSDELGSAALSLMQCR
jgi:hypothetical protein